MKVYDTRNEKGTLSALILIEAREIEHGEETSDNENLEIAINRAIRSFADTYDEADVCQSSLDR